MHLHVRIYSKLLHVATGTEDGVGMTILHAQCMRARTLSAGKQWSQNQHTVLHFIYNAEDSFHVLYTSAFQIKRTINICIFLKTKHFLEMRKRNWKKRRKNVAKLYKYRSSACEITVSTGGLYVNQAPDSSYHSDKQLQSWPSVWAAPDSKWLSYIRFAKLKM